MHSAVIASAPDDHAARGKAPAADRLSSREFADADGLISYAAHYPDLYRRAASYMRHAYSRAPSQPTCRCSSRPSCEIAINLKTAKALGIIVPPTLLARADEVIE